MAALTSKWPAIRTISCYIHLKRNVRRHKHIRNRFVHMSCGSTEKSIKDVLLSLHAVAVNTDVHIRDDMLALTPFSFDECGATRLKHSCDCAGHYSSGWLCSHTVAYLAIIDGFNIDARLRTLPQRKQNGRPRHPQGGLSVETRDEFFSQENLLKRISKLPLSIVGYKCCKDFKVCEDQDNSSRVWSLHTAIGVVVSHLPQKKRWTAQFEVNGERENVCYDGVKVSSAIHAVFIGGVDVTGGVDLDV
ncbi:hypothetical protein H257_11399 [Aphanomyces astaci]|uniref:SWIM-type domain-containing protein n=1 Tax=Aphanomyces astaci TaxID=112090 RepID=W4G326_APHAT|nr:hypothetical protein H257_11399 [Aphanomyces astaci]ETV74097.1 hypothetical protein H257_11399 [Aphanomyces astaci]|eukprot:XP_009836610.1 hypothetical protein H257_11399 [Aphanomyces astaci]